METKIFDYGMNGEGISKIDGKIVLVNHALCNETIELEIIEDNKNYSIGKIVNVLQASQNRINPICPYFDMCGGCQLQHMSYNEQLKFKALNIKKTIKKICNLDIDVKPCIPCSKPFNYRNKMSFSVQNSKCGLLEQNSKNIIDITHCTIASENINQVLSIFKKFLLSNPQKEIKNLVVRDIENQILVGVVATKHLSLKPLYDQLSKTFI